MYVINKKSMKSMEKNKQTLNWNSEINALILNAGISPLKSLNLNSDLLYLLFTWAEPDIFNQGSSTTVSRGRQVSADDRALKKTIIKKLLDSTFKEFNIFKQKYTTVSFAIPILL